MDRDQIDARAALNKLPPLIKGYLRLGGFVGDGAVIDPQFNTTDVAVVVQTDLVTEKYFRHYERQTREGQDGNDELGRARRRATARGQFQANGARAEGEVWLRGLGGHGGAQRGGGPKPKPESAAEPVAPGYSEAVARGKANQPWRTGGAPTTPLPGLATALAIFAVLASRLPAPASVEQRCPLSRRRCCGALSALALPPLYVLPALLIGIPVLLCLTQGARSPMVAARRGWWFGFGLHLVGLYWITEAILIEAARFWWLVPLAVPALSAVLAVFIAAATALAWWAQPGWRAAFALAGAWVLSDLARQFVATGFPWNPLGSVWAFPGGSAIS